MSNSPFLSVMIPVYNGEKYVANAIESVLGQPCEDLELVILNDGSTDRTLKIAQGYAREDSRVTVISHPNVGIGKNRNDGFQHLRGRAYLFLDDDDILVPGFYTQRTKETVAALFDKGVEVIVPARLYSNDKLTVARFDRVPLEGVMPGNGRACLNLPYEFTTLLYSGDVIKRENIRFSEGFPEMESIFRHRAVFCAKRALFTNDFYFIVRRSNPTQLTKTWDKTQVVRVRAEQYAQLVEWHRQRGTTGEVLEEIERRAQEAQETLASYVPVKPEGFFQRARRVARERRDQRSWETVLEPLDNYIYTGEAGERRLEAALASMSAAADIS